MNKLKELIKILLIYILLLFSDNLFAIGKYTIIIKDSIPLKEQIINENVIYKISHRHNLCGEFLQIPQGASLLFCGGIIENGKIVFNNNKLINPSFYNVRFEGSLNEEYFNICDYGAIPSTDMDCSVIINDLIRLSSTTLTARNSKTVFIPNGVFYIDNPIILYSGWEAPISLIGNGVSSTICQRTKNNYIIKIYENHYVKNLKLTYKDKQDINDIKSKAIACQRAIFCLFENLTITKSNTAFGYIALEDAKRDNLTKIKDQAYVSCNFRNIRIYDFSNYALDFYKEIDQGDSGSVFDNVYINSNNWLGNNKNNIAMGAIRGFNSVFCCTQLNIEGRNYLAPLIDLNGMSRLNVMCLHLEGIFNVPTIVQSKTQSVAIFDIIDVQSCYFLNKGYCSFNILDAGKIAIDNLLLRDDCSKQINNDRIKLSNLTSNRFKVDYMFDSNNIFSNR